MKYVGKDGTPVFYLSDEDFNQKLHGFLDGLPKEQWPRYMQDDALYMYRMTGIGYYPNGMATADGEIYIRYRARGDPELLAHEYGHVLGLGHTDSLTTMNAVGHKRFGDPHNLLPKTKANFPEIWRKHIHPHEAYRHTLIGGLGLMTAWAWFA